MLKLIKNIFSRAINLFLGLIYDEKCIICGCLKTEGFLCKTCLKDVNYLSIFAQRIYKNIPIYCATNYDGTIKKLIWKLKFQHRKNASKALAIILSNYFKKLKIEKNFIVVYPPVFSLKSAQRGYCHMDLIAKEFVKLNNNLSYSGKYIKKIKSTKPQYKAKNRHENIKGSFEINKKYIEKIKDKNILIIDDITTSGATLEELINCFLNLEVKNITCITISKAGF